VAASLSIPRRAFLLAHRETPSSGNSPLLLTSQRAVAPEDVSTLASVSEFDKLGRNLQPIFVSYRISVFGPIL